MTLSNRQKAWACVAGIAAVLAVVSYLRVIHAVTWAAWPFAVLCCYPWAKYAWQVFQYERRNTVRALNKALPKCGFAIENAGWNESETEFQFHGKYQGDNFVIVASPTVAYFWIYDLAWLCVKASDPSKHMVLEAINEINANAGNISVFITEPQEQGNRNILTVSKTILPFYKNAEFLACLMCDMLNQKAKFRESLEKERPWMARRAGPIGFNAGVTNDDENKQPSNIGTQTDSRAE